jgi:uncharacterized protein DUF4186
MKKARSHIMAAKQLEPLKVRCTSADCDSNLHCFRKSRQMAEIDRGKCRYCKADLIDWSRVQQRDLQDVKFTFKALKTEMIRHHFWHKELDERAVNHALRKGKTALLPSIHKRITNSIGPTQPYRDGFQTPYQGNVIYYAQHAVAACCRKCVEYWHGIPQGKPLSSKEINYLSALCEYYVAERMPDLPDNPTKIPRHGRR